jgi:hypothetical protein
MDDLSRLRIDGAKLPIWLRIVVVLALALLATCASLFAYRWYVRPVTLSIAVGSLDGDAPKIISALASRLAVNNAPVRLKVVETTGPIESADAFSSGKTDLAVVRGDVGDLLRRKPSSSWPRPWHCLLHRRDRRSRTWLA